MQGYNRGVVGDTLITMWDLSQKPISQLEVLDEILAYDESYVGQRNEKPNLGGMGFDGSHTGYNEHMKGIVQRINQSIVSKVVKVTFTNDPEETFGDYDDFSIIMTPDNLIQMSHDAGFECGLACPHVGWKTYDTDALIQNLPLMSIEKKKQTGKLSIGDLGYRAPNEYEPLPKDFHGPPDYLDEMRIGNIEELEGEFEVYHIIEAKNATMMFANNTILHVGLH